MGFLENIVMDLGLDVTSFNGFRAILYGDTAVYLENVKGIKKFSRCEIRLFLKKGELEVTGEDLYIKKYCCGDLVICGKITGLKRS